MSDLAARDRVRLSLLTPRRNEGNEGRVHKARPLLPSKAISGYLSNYIRIQATQVRKFHRVSAALAVQCVEELSETCMMLLVFRSNVQPSHSRGNLSGEQVCLLSAGVFARASSCPGGVFTRSRPQVWPSSCRWAAKVSTCSTGDGRNARSSGRCRRLARRFVWAGWDNLHRGIHHPAKKSSADNACAQNERTR
jgi:hypothetical protein